MSSSGVKVRDSEAMPPGTGEGKEECLDAAGNQSVRRSPPGNPSGWMWQLCPVTELPHSLCHVTHLQYVPPDRAGGSQGRHPRHRCTGDILPWEGAVPTPAQTPQVPLTAPQPRHRQQHRVPQLSSMRKRNKFPFPPQLNFPPEPLASCDDTARSSNILTCRQARHGPASPLINSTTIITVIADGSQWRRDQYLLLYDEFLHLRQPARKGNGSGRHQ